MEQIMEECLIEAHAGLRVKVSLKVMGFRNDFSNLSCVKCILL
jgi:hypothetical protein